MKLILSVALCALTLSFSAQANDWVTCRTSSPGFYGYFQAGDFNSVNARYSVVAQCQANIYTRKYDCQANAFCDVKCVAWTNGVRFAEVSPDPAVAYNMALSSCANSFRGNFQQCQTTLSCEQGGIPVYVAPAPTPGNPGYPGYPNPPTGQCTIRTPQGLVYVGVSPSDVINACRVRENSRGFVGHPEYCRADAVDCQ